MNKFLYFVNIIYGVLVKISIFFYTFFICFLPYIALLYEPLFIGIIRFLGSWLKIYEDVYFFLVKFWPGIYFTGMMFWCFCRDIWFFLTLGYIGFLIKLIPKIYSLGIALLDFQAALLDFQAVLVLLVSWFWNTIYIFLIEFDFIFSYLFCDFLTTFYTPWDGLYRTWIDLNSVFVIFLWGVLKTPYVILVELNFITFFLWINFWGNFYMSIVEVNFVCAFLVWELVNFIYTFFLNLSCIVFYIKAFTLNYYFDYSFFFYYLYKHYTLFFWDLVDFRDFLLFKFLFMAVGIEKYIIWRYKDVFVAHNNRAIVLLYICLRLLRQVSLTGS